MINKSKLIGIAAIVIVGFASPAFAQQRPDIGVNAFGTVPAGPDGGDFAPGANGGGSYGYNEHVRRDAW